MEDNKRGKRSTPSAWRATNGAMPLSCPIDVAKLPAAPIGQISLRCETRGCFHEEVFELDLSWAPSGFQLRAPATGARLDREQGLTLLRRVITAASLPEPSPWGRSTTVVDCALAWFATAKDHSESRGVQRWLSSCPTADEARGALALTDPEAWPAQLELPPEPAHELLSIARAPLQPEAQPRRFVAAVLELDARDQPAAVRALRTLLWERELPSLCMPRVLEERTAAGHVRLRMQYDVGKLLTRPVAAPLEEEPALRAMERALAEALGEVAVVRSVRYREVPLR